MSRESQSDILVGAGDRNAQTPVLAQTHADDLLIHCEIEAMCNEHAEKCRGVGLQSLTVS